MQVILKQDVNNLGHKDDLVTVKNGYARNYLIPRGMATNATPSAKKVLTETVKQRAHKEEKIKKEAAVNAEKIKGLQIKIGAKTSSKGKIFGSINTIQIAEAIEKAGIQVDRKNITIKEELIKEVGTYTAYVKLYKEIGANLTFEVFTE